MRSIEELYGRHPGSDIYVVGTGASLRVFPLAFLENKITIGLNMAWKVAPVQYSITIRPELNIPEFMGEPVAVIGRAHLIANKRAVGRLQDLADIEALERFRPDHGG